MKKLIPLFITVVFSVLLAVNISAQSLSQTQAPPASEYPYWIEWMQDPSVNFYDVQEAFNAYWEDRKIERSSGWKPYKRWEWWQERHIYPDGTRHEADKVYKAYNEYIDKFPQAKESNGNLSMYSL